MYKNLQLKSIILGLMVLMAQLNAQISYYTFDDQNYTDSEDLGKSFVINDLSFSVYNQDFQTSENDYNMYYEDASHENGYENSGLIYIGDQFDTDDPYYFIIKTIDGSNRSFKSFYAYDYAGVNQHNIIYTADAYRDGVLVGSQDFTVLPTLTKFNFNTNFRSIDEIRFRQKTPFSFPEEPTVFYPGVVMAFDHLETEILQKTVYVKKGVNETSDGKSWETAFTELTAAINFAKTNTNIDEIWVAEGVYKPQDYSGISRNSGQSAALIDRDKNFSLPVNVKIYGGFVGNETNLEERNWKDHPTILSGDLDDNSEANNADVFHVVIYRNNVGTAKLDGFTIQHAYADENGTSNTSVLKYGGAAILITDSSPELTNLVIQNTYGVRAGGAVYLNNSNAKFTNVIFKNNKSSNYGGAIYATNSNPVLTNTTFTLNESGAGSAIAIAGTTNLKLNNSVVFFNPKQGQEETENSFVVYNNATFQFKNSYIDSRNYSLSSSYDFGQNIFSDVNPFDENFGLKNSSLAINAGSDALYEEIEDNIELAKDLASNPRKYGESIDMGAYENQQIGAFTIWENNVWSNGTPDYSKDAILRESFTENILAKTLTFQANVNVPTGVVYDVMDEVVNESDYEVVFEDGAYLIQHNEVQNQGKIKFKRKSTPIYRLETLDWSSPVAGQNIFDFSPKTLQNRFSRYNESSNSWVANIQATDEFQMGEYIAFRAPNNYYNYGSGEAQVFEGIFTGVPFNGEVQLPMFKDNFGNNAVGNPYASPIDLDFLIDANSALDITKVFVWTHQHHIVDGVYQSNNWIVYNQLGWNDESVNSNSIGLGQGFIVQVNNPGTLIINNSMRNSDAQTVSFKNQSANKYWLSLYNETDEKMNSTLIGYTNGSSVAFDESFDAKPIETFAGIYSSLDDDLMTIQARGEIFNEDDQVDLSLNLIHKGNYTIKLTKEIGGELINQDIYLRDKQLDVLTNLKLSDYQFESEIGLIKNRFEIIYKTTTLSNDEVTTHNRLQVYTDDKTIHIKSDELIKNVKVMDILGRIVHVEDQVNNKNYSLRTAGYNQVLIVVIEDFNGKITSRKVNIR